jgi:hypothetical protein
MQYREVQSLCRLGEMMEATPGRIVHYVLTGADAERINRRRADFDAFRKSVNARGVDPGQPGRTGHVAHIGNAILKGDLLPAMVVALYGDSVNLKVFLDGNDDYWVTSCQEGPGEGQWSWPPRT